MHPHFQVRFEGRSGRPDPAPVQEALAALGLCTGHRVGLLCGTAPLHVTLHAACEEAGLAVVPLGMRHPDPALMAQMERCAVDAVVTDPAHLERAKAVRGDRPMLVLDSWGGVMDRSPGELGETHAEAAVVLETSGTTGTPRTVALSGAMLAAHEAAARKRLGDGPGAVWLGVLPLWHVGGVAMLRRTMHGGGTLLLHPRFDVARLAHSLLADQVTHVSLVPTMFSRLLHLWGHRAPPPTLRCVLLGGDGADEALVQDALRRGWPVWCTYGMTEACSQVATATPEERRAHPGTVGRPLDGVEVTLQVQADAAAGDLGEIVVAGPTVVGGRHATGDLGRMEEGLLWVQGRADDRIVSGGENVDPAEVERFLLGLPGIEEACVVGVPDPEWGQRVVAVLAAHQWNLEAWDAACRKALPAPAVPRMWARVAALPRTATGKVRRAEVRAQVTSASKVSYGDMDDDAPDAGAASTSPT